MLIISSKNSFEEKPCDRCGSKKRISKKWKEKIPTMTGTTVVEYSQIVCTNAICQKAFEENLEKETKKRELVKLEKEAKEKIRKTNSLLHLRKSRKNKSRI